LACILFWMILIRKCAVIASKNQVYFFSTSTVTS
jgi:hypothetical protein